MKFKIQKNFVIYFLLIVCFLFAQINFAFSADSTLSNTGFIKSGLWYSKDPFYSGDKIRIYTIIFNGSDSDLFGDIQFDDNSKLLCTGQVAVASGRTQELWCDWTATSGDHKITAKIINSKTAPIGESPRPIVLENNISGTSERIVKEAPAEKSLEKLQDPIKNTNASSSPLEDKIRNSLDVVQKSVTEIAPNEIKKEDVTKTTDKILSYIPEPVRSGAQKIAENTGLIKLETPLSYILDFFVAVYKFVINDPLVIIILLFIIFRSILKVIYNKITNMY